MIRTAIKHLIFEACIDTIYRQMFCNLALPKYARQSWGSIILNQQSRFGHDSYLRMLYENSDYSRYGRFDPSKFYVDMRGHIHEPKRVNR